MRRFEIGDESQRVFGGRIRMELNSLAIEKCTMRTDGCQCIELK